MSAVDFQCPTHQSAATSQKQSSLHFIIIQSTSVLRLLFAKKTSWRLRVTFWDFLFYRAAAAAGPQRGRRRDKRQTGGAVTDPTSSLKPRSCQQISLLNQSACHLFFFFLLFFGFPRKRRLSASAVSFTKHLCKWTALFSKEQGHGP